MNRHHPSIRWSSRLACTMSFLILLASTAYDRVPADHLWSAGGFSHARVYREHVPARMHSPPLRLDCSDPNSANATPRSSTPGFRKSKSKPGRVSKKTAVPRKFRSKQAKIDDMLEYAVARAP